MKLGFYKNEATGNFTTHSQGLTEQHIAHLHELKPGDRLIMYLNDNKLFVTGFDATLKLLPKRELVNETK